MVEAKAIAMKGVGDFVTVVRELGQIIVHRFKLDRINRILQDGRKEFAPFLSPQSS
jgi:hypothetical protein